MSGSVGPLETPNLSVPDSTALWDRAAASRSKQPQLACLIASSARLAVTLAGCLLLLAGATLTTTLQQALADGANTTSVTDVSNPDAYVCNQPGFIGFESLADGTRLPGTIAGLDFETTGGHTWLVGDFATGHYNGKYPNGKYMSQGTHWAWLGENQGSGRIDMANGDASYFSLLTSVGATPVYLEAYDASGNLLATAGPASYNIESGHMTELKITRATPDIHYVIVHDTGNFFLVDSICTDAPGVTETLPSLTATPVKPGELQLAGDHLAANEPVDVLLNTEAGAILLAQLHSGSDGAIPASLVPVGQPLRSFRGLTTSGLGFNVPNSDLGTLSVPLRDEHYQMSVIGESAGDGGSLQLNFLGGNLTAPSKTIGTTAGTSCTPATPPPIAPLSTSLPLSTNGRWVVEPPIPSLGGHQPRVKLASVNWYGAEEADFVPGGLNCQSLGTVSQTIQDDGFNSVRLPWSNAMLEENPPPCSPTTIGEPCIDPWFVHADPSLAGKNALGIYQAVVASLTRHGILTVLDDHTTDAEFCCIAKVKDKYLGFNGLWWGGQLWDDAFPRTPSKGDPYHWRPRQGLFQTDWHNMVALVAPPGSRQDVVGADLRNEPDGAYGMQAGWEGQGANKSTPTNWQEAAHQAAAAVLAVNPDLLIMVEGTGSGTDLEKVPGDPLRLSVNGREVSDKLVYSPHAYPFDNFGSDYAAFTSKLGSLWGVILTQNQPYTAPIWIGEFGASASQAGVISPVDPSTSCSEDSAFLNCFLNYIQGNDADWAWWGLNGTVSDSGAVVDSEGTLQQERAWFQGETYGVLDTRWASSASPLIDDLETVEQPTQFPPP